MKSFILLLLTISSASFASTSQTIVNSYRAGLEVTRLERMAPPYAAMMWAIANQAALKASEGVENRDLSYRAAFSRVLAKIKPGQASTAEGWLSRSDLTPEQEATVEKAQEVAEQVYRDHERDLEFKSRASSPPWEISRPLGEWRPTLPQFAQPALPFWGDQDLWSKADIAQLTRDLVPDQYNSQTAKSEIMQVYKLGGKDSAVRTKDQTEIAKFWVGGAGTVTPPGLWVHIAIQKIQSENLSFDSATKLMTALTSALCDAGVSAWWLKYEHVTWRPITAIQETLQDKNWLPLLATPPFPSYVSGHSTFSAAAAVILSHLVPLNGKLLKVTSPDLPGVVRQFKSYNQAAREAGMSRIYGGIHYNADNRDGLILGRRVACAVLAGKYESQCSPSELE